MEQGPDSAAERADDATDDLALFVDRLAAAGSDEVTAKAREQIRRTIAATATPPGLRHLAEALAATFAETPAPRKPAEDAATVGAAMRVSPLLILQDHDAAAVADAVAALVDDGRRVLVTAAATEELAGVRAALRPDVAERGLDTLPDLSPGELRELRRLLVTGSPDRAHRAGQQLPPAGRVPHPHEVAALCARAEHTPPPGPAAAIVPELLGGIDRVRREAVTSVARFVHRSLRAMYPRADRQWAWDLLGELIYSRHRPAFDQLLEDTAQAVAALERARHLPSVAVVAPLPPGALSILRRYGEFLFGGGRARAYLRAPAERRDALPVLRLLRVDGRPPQTADDVRRGVEHLELGERLSRIDLGCAAVGIPAPRDERELAELADGLVRVAAAARSVGALRHDVLFLAEDSPLAVPDVDTAEQVAAAILDYVENGGNADAGQGSTGWPRISPPPAPPWCGPPSTRPPCRPCGRATPRLTPPPSAPSVPPGGRRRTPVGSAACSTGCGPMRHSSPPPGSSSPHATPPHSASSASGRWRRCSPRCPSPTAPTSSSCSGRTAWGSSGCSWPPRHRGSSPSCRPARSARRALRRSACSNAPPLR